MTAEPKCLLDDEPTGRQEMTGATDAVCGPAAGPGAVERGACVAAIFHMLYGLH